MADKQFEVYIYFLYFENMHKFLYILIKGNKRNKNNGWKQLSDYRFELILEFTRSGENWSWRCHHK